MQDLNRVEVERTRTAVFSSWGKKKKKFHFGQFFFNKADTELTGFVISLFSMPEHSGTICLTINSPIQKKDESMDFFILNENNSVDHEIL